MGNAALWGDGQRNPGEASWRGPGQLYLLPPAMQQPLCSPCFQRSQRFQPGWPAEGNDAAPPAPAPALPARPLQLFL